MIVLFLLFSNVLMAQVETPADSAKVRYVIETNDGGEHIGYILADDGREVKFQTENKGVIFIPKYTIKSMKPLKDENYKNGEYLFQNPHASRYFYTPTGYALEKGEGYVQTIWGFYYQLQYGITDNFSLGIGTTFIGMPITLTPKYTFDLKEKLKLSVGAQVGTLTWLPITGLENPLMGIGYSTLTSGSKEHNVTLGVGYASINIDGQSEGGWAISAGGTTRLAKKISLVSEFWFLPESGVVFGGPGVRVMRKKDNALDFGFWMIGYEGEFVPFPIPMMSWTWGL